jgi:group I intron endonuclease
MIIYKITNNITKDFYIGKTSNNIETRFYHHKYNSQKRKSQTYLHRAMRKYGIDCFSILRIDEANTLQELNQKEIYWINSLSPQYNMTKGGEGGDTSNSPNYKKAIQQRDQSGIKNGMFGKKRNIPKQQLVNAHQAAKIANCCAVSCNGKIFNSVGEAQIAFPGISVRKKLDSEKYPTFFRLRPKTKRK